MASFDEVYDFLKQNYRHDRFEGRNDADCEDYSASVARSTLESLEKYGEAMISRHESCRGMAVKFNAKLEIIN